MKPLFVLLGTFVAVWLLLTLLRRSNPMRRAGVISMAVMLLFTSIGHFMYAEGMARMLPALIPFKKPIVMLTGVLEILAAVGLMVPRTRVIVGWCLIVFFITVLPANIYAAIHGIDYESGAATGPGLDYLWFRVPLQLFFIGWVYFFCIRKEPVRKANA